ncbi:MAG: hypothetical protein ACXWKP_02400 [Bradyrhizobium sp.]
MISKFIACIFLAAALTGCCASGIGCYAPLSGSDVAPLSGSQVAWDGLGTAPNDTADATELRPRKTSHPKREVAAGPRGDVPGDAYPRSKSDWEQQEAANQADDVKLAKKLKICRGCSPQPDNDATGSVSR